MATPPLFTPSTRPARTPPREEGSAATIVVGFDGSETSWSALWWACGEAARLGGRAIAVYVTCTTTTAAATAALVAGFDAGGYTIAMARCDADRAAELKAELARRTADVGLHVSFLHVQGHTADQLTRIAREARADVIAVGRSTKLRHQLAGSLGHGLSRSRKAPIVVIVP